MINIGVIGYGYWGPNIVRNIMETEGASVSVVCDKNEEAYQHLKKLHPAVKCVVDAEQVFIDDHLDAIAIITPVSSHYALARRALESGKHLFVEKPFTKTSQQAKTLIKLAREKGLLIMVDHTFVFTGAVKEIKQIIDSGGIGELSYYDSTRVNLGLFQHDVNVIWDLGPHDFSIMDYIVPLKPLALSAHGISHYEREDEDIAYVTIYFEEKFIAHFSFNWLSPVKIRDVMIGGTTKKILWNDLAIDEKIKIYDKSVHFGKVSAEQRCELLVDYRVNGMYSPKIPQAEALASEFAYFVECIENSRTPFNDGEAGLRVVQLLEATDRSIKNGGELVNL
ncbi:putative dehydrogenase [Sinobacterium caligoides]|uniref:Putative dehydrogenase n=1 Tax=Sinobacterium caligoides TaxID=933926 RepID=A0A3N2DKB7_9GAMM|nr:Gfo/Idh/MocA family oxidoreductase [Sinobacterium caligoides]ROS00122.1 putative dehydrogenase [Sinobacterium caligoides]